MNKTVIKILSRVLFMVILLIGFNYIYVNTTHNKDIAAYSDMLAEMNEILKDNEVIYFAESSNANSRYNDKDKRTISNKLKGYFKSFKIIDIDKGAQHAETYLNLIKNIPSNSNVKAVVVTMNLRSFGAGWRYSALESSIQQSLLLMRNEYPAIINRAALSFKAYLEKDDVKRMVKIHDEWKNIEIKAPFDLPHKTVTEWDMAQASGSYLTSNGDYNYCKIGLSCHFIKNYAFNIDFETNSRIADFDKIVDICQEKGIKTIFNILPENVELAEYLVSPILVRLMNYNKDLLVKRYSDKGAIVVDNLNILPSKEFTDYDFPTEHYASYGRQLIAYNVAKALNKLFPDEETIGIDSAPAQEDYIEYFPKQIALDSDINDFGSWSESYNDSIYTLLPEKEFSNTCKLDYHIYSRNNYRKLQINSSLSINDKQKETYLVTKIVDKNQYQVFYKQIKVNDIDEQLHETIKLPSSSSEKDQLIIYLWNPNGNKVQLKDFNFTFEPLENPKEAEIVS